MVVTYNEEFVKEKSYLDAPKVKDFYTVVTVHYLYGDYAISAWGIGYQYHKCMAEGTFLRLLYNLM